MLERILANEQASLGELEDPEAKAHRRAEIAQRERQLNEQRDRLEQSRSNFELAASAYLAALIEIDEDHPSDVVRDQASRLIVELDERGQERLAPAVELFVANIERRDADTALGRDAMLRHALP
jgi:L-lysine 2,3-aminomutase